MTLEDAQAELAQIRAREADLVAFIVAEKERRRQAAYRVATCPPCDWCGSTAHTVAERIHWEPTGRWVCRWNGPCRLAWMTGETPAEFQARMAGAR